MLCILSASTRLPTNGTLKSVLIWLALNWLLFYSLAAQTSPNPKIFPAGREIDNSRTAIGALFANNLHSDFHFSLFRYAINYHNHKLSNFSPPLAFGPSLSPNLAGNSVSRFVPVIGQIDTANPLAALQEVCSQSNRNIVSLVISPEVGGSGSSSLIDGITPNPAHSGSATFDNIRSLASLLKIPVISSFGALSKTSPSQRTVFSLLSDITEPENVHSPLASGPELFSLFPDLTPAIDAIVRHYQWTEIIYLYTDHGPPTSGWSRLEYLLERLSNANLKAAVRLQHSAQFRVPADANRQLETIEMNCPESRKIVILDCPAELARTVIQSHVNSIRMGRRNYHFLIGRIVPEDFYSTDLTPEFGAVNVTGFVLPGSSLLRAEQKQLEQFVHSYVSQFDGNTARSSNHFEWLYSIDSVFLFDAVKVITKAVSQVRATSKFNKPISDAGVVPTWLNCAQPFSGLKLIDFEQLRAAIAKTSVEGLSGSIQFNNDGNRKQILLDVIQTGVNRNSTKIAHWDELEQSLHISEVINTDDSSSALTPIIDITNKTFIVTSILEEPYLMLKNDPGLQGNDRFEGYSKDLADHISVHLNISYEIRVVKDSKYGGMVPNSTNEWNGMVGELVRHEADIAIAPLTITSARERVIDFTKPFMSLGISIMIKKPQKKNPGIFSFMDPLSSEIWMCVILSYVGVAVVLFLVSRFSPYEWRYEETVYGPHVSNDFSLYNSLWFALGAIMQQGCDVYPRSVAGRIVGSVWWFFTLILLSTYTANLAAFLTVERMVAPINSADDLAKQTEVEYGVLRDSSSMEFFRRSKIAVYQRMWDFMNIRKNVFVNSYKEGIGRVRESKGKYAFLIESTHNDYINERLPCDTLKVGRNLDAKGYGVATPRGSPIREQLNLAILYLTENGDLTRLENRWWYDRSECKSREQKDTSQNALTMNNVAGCFYILISGLLLAMIIALTEFFFKARQNSTRYNLPFGDAMKSIVNISVTGRPPKNFRPFKHDSNFMQEEPLSPNEQFDNDFH